MKKSQPIKKDSQPLTGKVSVRHYLNTKLKPRIAFGVEEYPIYVQVVFNRKNSNIRSNFNLFKKESIEQEIDIMDYLKNKRLYLFSDEYSSEKKFSSNIYKDAFVEESKVISGIVQFYGRYGLNILIENPDFYIIASLPFIKKVLSDNIKKKFKKAIESLYVQKRVDKDIVHLLNDEIQFDKQFEVLQKYGNDVIQDIINPFKKDYDMVKLMNFDSKPRVFEWIQADVKSLLTEKFKDYPDLINNIKEAIVKHYKDMFGDSEYSFLREKIEKEV